MSERETMPFDVVIVGGGPAGLATAIHLAQLIEKAPSGHASAGAQIVVLEKGQEVGSHAISGAVMDPRGLDALLPGWRTMEPKAPVECAVETDYALWLTAKGGWKLPITPPTLRNHGNYVVSLNKLVRWLAQVAEQKGIQVLPGFPGYQLVREGAGVRGVQLVDAGLDKNGQPKEGQHAPGAILQSKITVLAEGSRGSLTKQLAKDLRLDGVNPMIYAIGVKEVWEVDAGKCPPGLVVHTMGYPLKGDTFGGGWVYGMGATEGGKNLVSIGLVVGLDYPDPSLDPHREFQRYKLNPRIHAFLEGGRLISYGAKSLPEGGLLSMPRMHGDGFLVVGDSAGFVNMTTLKGIHLGIESGMLAAQTIFECLGKGDFGADATRRYEELFRQHVSWRELHKARNFRQGFHKGRLYGLLNAGFGQVFGGRGLLWADRLGTRAGHTYMERVHDLPGGKKPEQPKLPEDGTLTFDKLTDLYSSGTKHEEDQPCHLVVADTSICTNRCTEEYGNPCQHFCPAAVYEMEPAAEPGKLKLKINASNCVHCKTCDIMDPYQIINWVTPEGGGGPQYQYL